VCLEERIYQANSYQSPAKGHLSAGARSLHIECGTWNTRWNLALSPPSLYRPHSLSPQSQAVTGDGWQCLPGGGQKGFPWHQGYGWSLALHTQNLNDVGTRWAPLWSGPDLRDLCGDLGSHFINFLMKNAAVVLAVHGPPFPECKAPGQPNPKVV
jgi:hypothetical protein